MHTTRIEQQLTILLRRTQRIHFTTAAGEVELDRSGYGIMCRLQDEGAQRLSALAQAFGLDPSTITRQVQALETNGLVRREVDPTDRRASLLDLSEEGRDRLIQTRERRLAALKAALGDWSAQDLDDFGRLLEQFNTSIDRLVQRVGSDRGD